MVEKPPPAKAPSNLAAPGRYIFTNDIFQALEEISRSPDGEYQLTDAINLLATNSNVYAHTLCSKRYDTGNLEGYLDATLEFALMSDKYSPIMKDLICKKVKNITYESKNVYNMCTCLDRDIRLNSYHGRSF